MEELKKHSLYKQFEVEDSLSAIFNIYFKKFPVLFVSSFLALFVLQMIMYQLGFWEFYKLNDPQEMMEMLPAFMTKIAIFSSLSFLIYGVINSFLINYIIKSDIDPERSIGDIISESLRKFSIHMVFFLLVSSFIVVGGAFIGILAFIIGSLVAFLYLGAVLMVGGTIVVAEERNAIETIGRSFKLVHKDFWPVLGTLILFFLIIILISVILGAIAAIPLLFAFFENFKETGSILEALNIKMYDIGIWTVVINSIVSAVTYPLYSILSTVLYFKLKFKEDRENTVTQ